MSQFKQWNHNRAKALSQQLRLEAREQARAESERERHEKIVQAREGIQKFLLGEILVQNVIPAQAGIQKSNQGFALQSSVADRLVSIS